jgi:RTX calcium-binding nonapeptide repeat (4 copies)
MGRRTTFGAGISVGAIMALPASAQADDIKVKNLNDSGPGSLARAIENANDDADADRILFKSKLSGTIELTANDPLYILRGDLNIRGPGARKLSVDAGGDSRVFTVSAGFNGLPPIDVTISGLTITGGVADDPGPAGDPGDLGGGILNVGPNTSAVGPDLTLKNVAVRGNTAAEDGGGVRNLGGDLTIKSSTISGNTATQDGGGVATNKGQRISVIRRSTITGNHAGDLGGGVYLVGTNPSTTAIRNSTVADNEATNAGGGVYETGYGATIRGSIVAGNTGSPADLDDGPWLTSFSLIGDTKGATGLEDDGGNFFDVDPNLKPLRNNGGPTDTHAFKKSAAKNKVPKGQSEKKDQRGAPRKGKGDIGAYELVKCEGVVVNRVGTGKNDKLKGTKNKDGILGLGGNDKLSGKQGADGLCGGKGKDKLKGGPGKDSLDGGPGKDTEVQQVRRQARLDG